MGGVNDMTLGELINPDLAISRRPDITKVLSLSAQKYINQYKNLLGERGNF